MLALRVCCVRLPQNIRANKLDYLCWRAREQTDTHTPKQCADTHTHFRVFFCLCVCVLLNMQHAYYEQ